MHYKSITVAVSKYLLLLGSKNKHYKDNIGDITTVKVSLTCYNAAFEMKWFLIHQCNVISLINVCAIMTKTIINSAITVTLEWKRVENKAESGEEN